MAETENEKLILLEHLRQLNDTLIRLAARRRRLRAERRLQINRLKGLVMFGYAMWVVLAAAMLAVFFLPIFAIDQMIIWFILVGLFFLIGVALLIRVARTNSILFGKKSWVIKRLRPLDKRLAAIDVEMSSLLSIDLLEESPLDAGLIDKGNLQLAMDVVRQTPSVTWSELANQLATRILLNRVRRQSLLASEWLRLFGKPFPNR